MKAVIDEVDAIESFSATVNGKAVTDIDTFRTDPMAERWEVNFRLPDEAGSGVHTLELRLGKRLLTRAPIEVVR
jgi:hypothetical protein